MTMQNTLGSQEFPDLDLSKVTALQQKRTIAFVNHFTITTVQFLNNFMKNCERKLMEFERKLEKVEAGMVLLEARLSSIPEVSTEVEIKPDVAPTESALKSADETDMPTESQTESQPTESLPGEQNTTEIRHPEYDRFVKMVQVGVPLEAVKLKISTEGLDPNVLVQIIEKK